MKRAVVEEIKSRLSIVECIEQYIKIEKAGKNYKAVCPFHPEKTASFYISAERDTYYCFGCGKKGDIFSFVEEYEGIDFKAALKLLAEKTNVTIEDFAFKDANPDAKKILYTILEEATNFYQTALKTSDTAALYVKNRGVHPDTIDTYRIGYAPQSWDALYMHLKKKGYEDNDIENAGLIKSGQYKKYDRFRNRIMFPFLDTNGRVIGFSGRTIDTDSQEAKYINSPESILFNKGKVLFGLYQAKDSIRKGKSVIVVEGQMDVIMTAQSGVGQVVASSGTAFSGDAYGADGMISHLGIIKRFTDNIYLAFDNDKAGIKAMYSATLGALESGFTVSCVPITNGKDMAEIAQSQGGDAIRALVNQKQDAILFFVQYLKKHTTEKIFFKSISEKIWPLVVLIKSPIEQSHMLSVIAPLVQVPEATIHEDFKKYRTDKTRYTALAIESTQKNHQLLDTLFGLVFFFEQTAEINLESNHFEEKLRSIIKDDYESLKETYSQKKEELIFLIEKSYTTQEHITKDSIFLLETFERDFYKQKLVKLKNDMKQDELLGIDTQDKLEEVAEITKKMTLGTK